jgi:TrmH RNA methyltransferase
VIGARPRAACYNRAVPQQRPPSRSRATRDPVERVYGLSAALAAFRARPELIVNVAYTAAARRELGPMLREAAQRRIAYREVGEEELARMTDSQHHEGVCLLVRVARAATLDDLARRASPRGLIVALDGVSNPHNAGAILRTAAFFGASGLLLGGANKPLTPAALRVAEGGAEHVPVVHVPDLPAALRALRDAGCGIVGADAAARMPLSELDWPQRAVIVLGHEREGLADDVRAACDVGVHIAGSGAMDSLNVSVAAGVLIASYFG